MRERPYKGNAGGAALTNVAIIQEGERRGYEIDIITKETNYRNYDFSKVDLVIMSHVPGMDQGFINDIVNNCKYVRWDHAYDFCKAGVKHMSNTCFQNKCDSNQRCAYEYYLNIHKKAILSVFQSPLHKRIQETIIGENLDNVFILVPPIDVEHFKVLDGVVRKKNTCIVVGSIAKHKGLDNVLEYADKKKNMQFDFVGNPKDYLGEIQKRSNCYALGKMLNYQLPLVYNSYEYYMHLPCWWEPSSRSTMEAFLCGCKLITNEKVGTMSFPFMSQDKRKIVHAVRKAPGAFWRAVEEAYENS
jgi:glycosyltransferase involved in cell wall biosynthesis